MSGPPPATSSSSCSPRTPAKMLPGSSWRSKSSAKSACSSSRWASQNAASRGLPSSSSPSQTKTWRHGLGAEANARMEAASAPFEFAAPRATTLPSRRCAANGSTVHCAPGGWTSYIP